MIYYTLPAEKLAELRASHPETRDKRDADRIKAVGLLAGGWAAEGVADALLIDRNIARSHYMCYREDGLRGLLQVASRGSQGELNEAALDAQVRSYLYLTARGVASWVETQFAVRYTASGITGVLHRRGFVYKKPRLEQGKADPKAQEAFLVW